jgi:Cu-Zn family superoxide dismutase
VNETVTSSSPAEEAEPLPRGPSKSIRVTIAAKSGSKLKGSASLSEKAEGVQIVIDLEGVPAGEHAAHIHEKADCSAANASSAGEHFNPHGHQHGLPNEEQRHLGDLGNITIDKEGKGTLEIVIPGANLRDVDEHSFVGRALIIHEKKDDGGQPSGNAGGRIGCAEIK